MQAAVQAPAASQHVPVAFVCLHAASPNAKCELAVWCSARCLTLQSRGRRPASRAPPLISNVRQRVKQRACSKSLSALAWRTWAAPARAVRPASLAASAPAVALDAGASQASARAAHPLASGALPEPLVGRACVRTVAFKKAGLSEHCGYRSAVRSAFQGRTGSLKTSKVSRAKLYVIQTQALRKSAKPKARGRAGTSCFAARAGGVRLLASSTTQRTMHAGSVVLSPLPNPSINRTSPGKPGAACYLKR